MSKNSSEKTVSLKCQPEEKIEAMLLTAPEHACHELIRLNGVTFEAMCLKVQEARQSDTRFNKKRNIKKSSFERNIKSAADSIYSPNRFELLNCETTENDENDHPYHKDTSIVGIDTINHHSRYKQLKRPEAVANRFPENQHTFRKKCTDPGEKTYKEAVTEKANKYYPHQCCYSRR